MKLLAIVLALGCAHMRAHTYEIAQNGTRFHLPLMEQQRGAAILCKVGEATVRVTVLRETAVRVEDARGRRVERAPPIEFDEYGREARVAALPIRWPAGGSRRCGIDPASPPQSRLEVFARRLRIEVWRVDGEEALYFIGSRAIFLHAPLTDEDRRTLVSRGVPRSVTNALH